MSLALGPAAKAAPGDLDPSFDADGLVLTHFGRIDDDSPGGRNDSASFVVVQPDGKLVVAGSSEASGVFFGSGFALARYNPDGTPDASFGTGGRVLTELPSAFGFMGISALIVQPDGKVVVAAQSNTALPGADFSLARYNPDGSLDASFGSGGLVVTDFGTDADVTSDSASALVLQTDGKLVAAGLSIVLAFGPTFELPDIDFALARYNPDGSLDTSFGSGGLVRTAFDVPVPIIGVGASALVLQPDGKLVAAGSSGCRLALARYNPDGSLDSTFGSGGLVSGCDSQQPFADALVLQPDGKLVYRFAKSLTN